MKAIFNSFYGIIDFPIVIWLLAVLYQTHNNS